jgi:hypothetical protein
MLSYMLPVSAPPLHDRDLVFCESYRRAASLTSPTATGRLPVVVGADTPVNKTSCHRSAPFAQAGAAEARIASKHRTVLLLRFALPFLRRFLPCILTGKCTISGQLLQLNRRNPQGWRFSG